MSAENELTKEGIKAVVDTAKGFLEKLVGPPLEELGGLLADQVRFYRFKNQVKILLKAHKFLGEAGINPRRVSLKTLVPILEEGALEEDESMSDRWASLLATAADPNSKISVQPSFPEVLKELSPKEALIIDKIFDMVISLPIPREEWSFRGAVGDSIKQVFHLSDEEFEIAIDNLYRLRLCSAPSIKLGFIDRPEQKFQLQMKDIICLTDFGFAFVSACRRYKEKE
ncbi:MAG: Abi-alpha family protein [Candidatus Thermoplasmatota archaeon]